MFDFYGSAYGGVLQFVNTLQMVLLNKMQTCEVDVFWVVCSATIPCLGA